MADDATLSYSGTFDGSQIIAEAGQADAAFAKMGTTASNAFTQTAGSAKPAEAGIKAVSAAQREAATTAENLGFKEDHLALTFRQVNREATEGARGIAGAMAAINVGALDSASALDVFRIAAGAAFHGPETLVIVGIAAAVGLLVEKFKTASEAARDVKWFGDEVGVTERFDTLTAQYDTLLAKQHEIESGTPKGVSDPLADAHAIGLKAAKDQLDVATKYKDNLAQQRQLESEIANIEADKVRLQGQAELAVSRTDNPVSKMQAQQNEVVQEKQREQQQLELMIKDDGLKMDILNDQVRATAKTKEEIAEKAKNEVAQKNLSARIEKEKAMATAEGDALVDIEKANQNNLARAKNEAALKQTKQEFAGQSDTEASPAYLKMLKDQEEDAVQHQNFMKEMQNETYNTSEDQFAKQKSQLEQWYDDKMKIIEKGERDGVKTQAEADQERMALLVAFRSKSEIIEAQAAAAQAKNDQKVLNAKLQLADAVGSLAEQMAGKSKAAFLISKGIAAANIFVNTEEAASAAVAMPPIGLGPVLGLPLAGIIEATGIAQEAAVLASTIQGFEGGGYTGPGARNKPVGIVHADEFVISGPDLARMGGPAAVSSMISNSRGGDSYIGGTTNITINAAPNHSPSDIATAVANHPAFKDQYRLLLTQRQANYQRTQA